MIKIPKTTIAYAAGFMDGEGCIIITLSKRPANTSHFVSVRISNSVREPLDLIKNYYGGSICKLIRKNPKWKDTFAYCIASQKAKVFLKSVLPYLIIKKPQAELAMKFFALPRYSGGLGRLSSETLKEREELKKQMSFLNRKGKGV